MPSPSASSPPPEPAAATADAGEARRGATGLWQRIPPTQRWIIVGAAAACLAVLAWIAAGGLGPKWPVVARPGSVADRDAVTATLKARGIPFRVDGDAIEVPPDRLYEARLEVASDVLPSNKTVGFELFDTSELGRSAFAEKVNYHRALEGELARTIEHLAPVRAARVHLVLPDRRLFKRDEVEPTASVVVALRPGETLSRRQVEAVRQLVAAAVERLKPQRVAIVDDAGRMLARPEDPDMPSEGAFEYRWQYERNLEQRIVHLLEPLVGTGAVRAQVAAQFDFSRVVETREDFDPDNQVVRSEREKTETRTGGAGPAAGVPGTGSNLPGRAPAPTAAAMEGARKEERLTNYEIGHATWKREQPVARLERLTVAVAVDHVRERKEDGSVVVRPRTPEELEKLRSLVARAVGLDAKRGDSLELVDVQFNAAPQFEELVEHEPRPTGRPWWQWALLAALVLAVLVVAGLAMRRARQARQPARGALVHAVAGDGEVVGPDGAVAGKGHEPRSLAERIEDLQEEVVRRALSDPQRAATVMRTWLREAEQGSKA